MDRREFIILLGGAAALLPLAAHTREAVPVIGFLGSGSPKTFSPHIKGFLNGLKQGSLIDGQNIKIEYRWAEGQFARLSALATELVERQVAILVATGGNVSALAAKGATTRIPIIFLTADDPVSSGLVVSLSRPGGNITGVTWLGAELGAKNLELVRELLPSVREIGVLVNPDRPTAETQLKNAQDAATAVGRKIRVLRANKSDNIEAAFKTAASEHLGALFIASDPMFLINRDQILRLAEKNAIPTVYFLREFVDAGGLMSYGASLEDAARLCGDYASRILRGAKPADLPVQQSTKVELIFNLKTAKSLGLAVPATFLARADEVIE